MRIFDKISAKLLLVLCLSIISLSIISCSGTNTSNTNVSSTAANQSSNSNTRAVKDDVAELSTMINFPEQPEEGVWREESVNQKGKKLTAVLKFSNEGVAKTIASAEKRKPAERTEVDVEEWFPEELTAQSQLSATETLKGNVYAANDFYNAPYTNGKLIRIQDTNYFVLELDAF